MERTEEMDLESEIFNTHHIRYVLHYLWGKRNDFCWKQNMETCSSTPGAFDKIAKLLHIFRVHYLM